MEHKSYVKDKVVFSLKNIHTKHLNGLSLKVHEGEIVGVFDIENKANKDLEKLITGQSPINEGIMNLDNRKYEPLKLHNAIRQGIGYIQGDFINNSIFSKMSILDNITLPVIKKTSKFRVLVNWKIERFVKKECLNIVKASESEVNNSPSAVNSTLSQLIIYNRWMLFNPKLLLCVETLCSS